MPAPTAPAARLAGIKCRASPTFCDTRAATLMPALQAYMVATGTASRADIFPVQNQRPNATAAPKKKPIGTSLTVRKKTAHTGTSSQGRYLSKPTTTEKRPETRPRAAIRISGRCRQAAFEAADDMLGAPTFAC